MTDERVNEMSPVGEVVPAEAGQETPPAMQKRKKKHSAISIINQVLVYVVLILLALVVLVPFYLVIISSFKSNYEINASVGQSFRWWPERFSKDGYAAVISTGGEVEFILGSTVIGAFFNTLWQSLVPALVGVFVSGMCGYALAKLKFPFRNSIFTLLLATMMIPGTITMVSSYMLFDTIGWTEGPLPLIIPGLFGGASNVFFMRQYFEGVPDELLDAAKIDGLDNFRTFLYIAMPVSVPVFVSLSLLSFIGHYNAYLNPLIYIGSNSQFYTLQVMLSKMTGGLLKGHWDMILAACVLSILPLLLIYLITQKFFIKGISISSGLKG